MPYVMSLEGPHLGAARRQAKPSLLGIFDVVTTPVAGVGGHPWIFIGGLIFGGWLAGEAGQKALASWGVGRMAHTRARSLSGARHRRRKHRR